MYKSLAAWIKQTFSQNDPIAEQNELTPEEIEQLMAMERALEPDMATRLMNSRDSTFEVDDDTGKVTITMRDLSGTRQVYGYGYNYWFHPNNFDVLVNDVVVAASAYVFYPVGLDLEFLSARPTGAVVKIRGHVIRQRELMRAVADQWLLKISMVVDIKSTEFDRLTRRFNATANRLYGARFIRRWH